MNNCDIIKGTSPYTLFSCIDHINQRLETCNFASSIFFGTETPRRQKSVSCEAKPSQGYGFIDRQIRIENHEFLQGFFPPFLEGNESEQRHIKNNEGS